MNINKTLIKLSKIGLAPQLVYDDHGKFAMTTECCFETIPKPRQINCYIDKKAWKKTPKKALEYFIKMYREKHGDKSAI
jgi:hypothetical protein